MSNELFDLSGRTALVTGASRGIGEAIAHLLAHYGAHVVCTSRKLDGCQAVADAITAKGLKAEAAAMHIGDTDAIDALFDGFAAQGRQVDVLVNNAGWDRAGNFLDTDKALWDQVVAVNLYGPLFMHHAVLKGMSDRGRGRVVNIASDAARVGSTGEAVYALCKGGMIAFSKTMARELSRKQISVNVVCPGPTDTALFADFAGEGEGADKLRQGLARAIPFGRLGQPSDLPGAIAFLASDDAAFITGQVISVSGGLTMVG